MLRQGIIEAEFGLRAPPDMYRSLESSLMMHLLAMICSTR